MHKRAKWILAIRYYMVASVKEPRLPRPTSPEGVTAACPSVCLPPAPRSRSAGPDLARLERARGLAAEAGRAWLQLQWLQSAGPMNHNFLNQHSRSTIFLPQACLNKIIMLCFCLATRGDTAGEGLGRGTPPARLSPGGCPARGLLCRISLCPLVALFISKHFTKCG